MHWQHSLPARGKATKRDKKNRVTIGCECDVTPPPKPVPSYQTTERGEGAS